MKFLLGQRLFNNIFVQLELAIPYPRNKQKKLNKIRRKNKIIIIQLNERKKLIKLNKINFIQEN